MEASLGFPAELSLTDHTLTHGVHRLHEHPAKFKRD